MTSTAVRSLLSLWVLWALCACACSDSKKPADKGPGRCEQAVAHLMQVVNQIGSDVVTPGPRELALQAEIRKTLTSRCEKDGLSEAQLKCIVSAMRPRDLKSLRNCEPLRKDPAKWLNVYLEAKPVHPR
jgi:hypothetical protein